MKQVGGVWLPDHEEHLVGWMQHPKNRVLVDGKLAYQWKKQQLAMSFVKQWRTAVDVGAHCGLWSMHLVKRFQQLHAFEPVEEHRKCWTRNVLEANPETNALLYPVALGEKDGVVSLRTTHTSSGDTMISDEKPSGADHISQDIPLKRMDDYMFSDVDFIKLDCEGYELFALRGGEETLKRCRPCIIVEQKPGRGQRFGLPERGAVDYLQSLGAVLRREISGDFILSWD